MITVKVWKLLLIISLNFISFVASYFILSSSSNIRNNHNHHQNDKMKQKLITNFHQSLLELSSKRRGLSFITNNIHNNIDNNICYRQHFSTKEKYYHHHKNHFFNKKSPSYLLQTYRCSSFINDDENKHKNKNKNNINQVIKSILYIGATWPEYNASAAGVRSFQILNGLHKNGYKVFFGTPSKEKIEYMNELKGNGIDICGCPMNDKIFESNLLEIKPDIVIFDRFYMEEAFSWRVKKCLPNSLRVIDTQDLHFLRIEREHAYEKGKSIEEIEKLNINSDSDILLRELSSIHRSDLIILVSDYEKHLLENVYNINKNKVFIAPFFYPKAIVNNVDNGYDERKDFVMIGNFRHKPNVDSFKWVRDSIWPKIRKQLGSNVELHVFGAYAKEEHLKSTNVEQGFIVKGQIKDQYKALKKKKVLLAPLRFGAGIKGKISDSWLVGTPVVTTTIGAEGMGYKYCEINGESKQKSWGGIIGNSEEEIIKGALTLYNNETNWKVSQANGLQLLNDLFNKEKNMQTMIELFEKAHLNLNDRRLLDFTYALLWQSQNQHIKYLSKYIEFKNKIQNDNKQQRK